MEWFGHIKRRNETEKVRAVAEMKMEGKRPRGTPKLRWNDTVTRDLKAWNIREEILYVMQSARFHRNIV